jgi:hypothetical protein
MMGILAMIHGVAAKQQQKSYMADALKRCERAFRNAYLRTKAEGNEYGADSAGRDAYKAALPALDTVEEIRAYIACVAQGINLGVYDGKDGSQLLYAAQIAISVIRQKGKKDAA